jgi:hypothetical protein
MGHRGPLRIPTRCQLLSARVVRRSAASFFSRGERLAAQRAALASCAAGAVAGCLARTMRGSHHKCRPLWRSADQRSCVTRPPSKKDCNKVLAFNDFYQVVSDLKQKPAEGAPFSFRFRPRFLFRPTYTHLGRGIFSMKSWYLVGNPPRLNRLTGRNTYFLRVSEE